MKIFCDTSVLVAASVQSHEHHARAIAILERVAQGHDEGVIGAHSLAEMYAVLTRLPVTPRIQPDEAAALIEENVVKHFKMLTLSAHEYASLIRHASANGIVGGALYDALLLACAEKAKVARIYTFNVADFKRLAPALDSLITAP